MGQISLGGGWQVDIIVHLAFLLLSCCILDQRFPIPLKYITISGVSLGAECWSLKNQMEASIVKQALTFVGMGWDPIGNYSNGATYYSE